MLNTTKLLRSEIAWLAISLVFTLAFAFIFFGVGVFAGTLDLHIHDTYFVTPAYLILLFLFLIFTFIFFYFKSSKAAYRTSPSFAIACVSGTLVALIMSVLTVPIATILGIGSLTLYPPLSDLGNDQMLGSQPGLPFLIISGLLIAMAIVVVVLTLFKAYKWGQYRVSNFRDE
jgi:hypothetical protein